MQTKLKPYRGKLNAEQIVDGMNAAVRNARRLADDAKTLLGLSRYPSAASLAVLSIEESGKVSVLRLMAAAPDDQSLRSRWKEYTNHRIKNATWVLPGLIEKGFFDLATLSVVVKPNSKHAALMDQLKQLSLYTDCLNDVDWVEPEKLFDKELACQFVDIANKMAINKIYTLKEMELWIEHMKPVCYGSLEDMKEAMFNFCKSMEKEGLNDEGAILTQDFLKALFEKDA